MKRIRLGHLLAAALVLIVSASCGSGSSPARSVGAKTTVTLWQGSDTPFLDTGIKQFEKENPNINIAVDTSQRQEYLQRINLNVPTKRAPDLFTTFGGGLYYKQFMPPGDPELLELSARLPDVKKYSKNVLGPVTTNGGVYGVPFEGPQPEIFFYNKETFRRAGIENPPKTWADFLADIEKLRSHQIIPIAQGNENWALMIWPMYFAARFGGTQLWHDVLTQQPGAWSSPEMAKAMQMSLKLRDANAFESGYLGVPWENGVPTQLIASGRAGMELMISKEVANMQSKTPAIINSDNLGYFAFPSVPGGTNNQGYVVGNPSVYFAIPKTAQHRQAALKFLNFLMSKQYLEDQIKGGEIPGRADADALVRTTKMSPALKRWDNYAYKLVEGAPQYLQVWDQALPADTSNSMQQDIGKVFGGSMSVSQFGSDLDSRSGG